MPIGGTSGAGDVVSSDVMASASSSSVFRWMSRVASVLLRDFVSSIVFISLLCDADLYVVVEVLIVYRRKSSPSIDFGFAFWEG